MLKNDVMINKEKTGFKSNKIVKNGKSDWNPSMGDFKKNNSQTDSELLRKSQVKYKLLISFLTAALIVLFIGSIIFFSL